MTPAERAERLMVVSPPVVEPARHGDWKWRVIGREIQLRTKRLPHLHLDLTITEAVDLREALYDCILEQKSRPVVRVGWWDRAVDWLARRTWRRKHAFEQAEALKALAKEFADTRGGW